LACYQNFAEHGYNFVAAVDSDPTKVGTKLPSGLEVHAPSELKRLAVEKKIDIAIITTPPQTAQEAADTAAAAGIRGILNFAPVQLSMPANVRVKKVDLTTEFDNLAYHLYAG
jgi:redox-sensing transcriptional repressor